MAQPQPFGCREGKGFVSSWMPTAGPGSSTGQGELQGCQKRNRRMEGTPGVPEKKEKAGKSFRDARKEGEGWKELQGCQKRNRRMEGDPGMPEKKEKAGRSSRDGRKGAGGWKGKASGSAACSCHLPALIAAHRSRPGAASPGQSPDCLSPLSGSSGDIPDLDLCPVQRQSSAERNRVTPGIGDCCGGQGVTLPWGCQIPLPAPPELGKRDGNGEWTNSGLPGNSSPL